MKIQKLNKHLAKMKWHIRNNAHSETILPKCDIKQGSRALDCLQNGVNSANISQLLAQLFGNLFFAKTKPIYVFLFYRLSLLQMKETQKLFDLALIFISQAFFEKNLRLRLIKWVTLSFILLIESSSQRSIFILL